MADLPLHSFTGMQHSHGRRLMKRWVWLGVAVLTATCLLLGGWSTDLAKSARMRVGLWSPHPSTPSDDSILSQHPRPPPHLPTKLSLEEIQALVGTTKGFFARDYNLELGWNNMRYIIEAALLHAKLLGRTLILPSFVYARSCEYEITVCADYAEMVNRGDAVHSDEWTKLPIEEQMGWKIPIELMINITHLRESHPVITVADYLRLHGLSPTTEASDGKWSEERYHVRPNVLTGSYPSLSKIPNADFDPPEIVRVDEITEDMERRLNETIESPEIEQALFGALEENKLILSWEKAQSALGIHSDVALEDAVLKNRWTVLYTYAAILGLDYNKGVVKPIRQIAPLHVLRGFKNDWNAKATTVVHLEGALHYARKSGSMYFTSRAAQDDYSSIVLYHMTRIDALYALAQRLIQHMFDLNGGRLWTAAHVRRGDFVRYEWTMESTPKAHIARVKEHMDGGREVLTRLSTKMLKTYDVPGNPSIDESVHTLRPPLPGDKFYVATDERDLANLDIFREAGAVLMEDLLTIEDRRLFGKSPTDPVDASWALILTDVRAVVEQIVMSEAGYFYGHAMSSVPGGVVNMRAGRGKDPRTTLID